jgi:hypothetical protein
VAVMAVAAGVAAILAVRSAPRLFGLVTSLLQGR